MSDTTDSECSNAPRFGNAHKKHVLQKMWQMRRLLDDCFLHVEMARVPKATVAMDRLLGLCISCLGDLILAERGYLRPSGGKDKERAKQGARNFIAVLGFMLERAGKALNDDDWTRAWKYADSQRQPLHILVDILGRGVERGRELGRHRNVEEAQRMLAALDEEAKHPSRPLSPEQRAALYADLPSYTGDEEPADDAGPTHDKRWEVLRARIAANAPDRGRFVLDWMDELEVTDDAGR